MYHPFPVQFTVDLSRDYYGPMRQLQKGFLASMYLDYNPKLHDMFLIRWQGDNDRIRLKEYMQTRGIIS